MGEVLIQVKNLTKTFESKEGVKTALEDISLTLARGEMAALVGPDGSGKTTFLRLLAGLLLPDSDCNYLKSNKGGFIKKIFSTKEIVKPENFCKTILIDNFCPTNDLEDVKNIIGYMPQKFGLYEDLSVIENLNLYSALNNQKNNSKEIDTLLDFAGLIDFKDRLAGNLSGGMKQKLGLSCTLIFKPQLLLLDEPSVGVDPLSRRELMKMVEKLVKENNIAVIWSTSYLDEAENFERVFFFSEGEKLYDGSPKSAAETMSGLVFLAKKEGENLRGLLRNILKDLQNGGKPLVDGVIEGDKIRLVFQNKRFADEFFLPKIEANPRFEDFVMYTLKSRLAAVSANASFDNALFNNVSNVKAPENNVTIKAEGLTKVYGKFTAADKISFEIKKGEIFGLLGPNGAGKSTTFKMLCGLIRPTSGKCAIMGVGMDKNPVLARSFLGYMAQKFSLFGNLSVLQNLDFFAGVYGLFGFEKTKRIKLLIDFFDLGQYKDTNAEDLPLGYKQRLALSCAIVHKPPVLFLDEPTSGVDLISRREFWSQINSLSENGTTILITTHFMDEAQYCDRISLIFKGKSLITAAPDELKNSVKTEENPDPTMEDAFIELISRENNKVMVPKDE